MTYDRRWSALNDVPKTDQNKAKMGAKEGVEKV